MREDTAAVRARTGDVRALALDFVDFVVSEQALGAMVRDGRGPIDEHEQVIDEVRLLRRLGLWHDDVAGDAAGGGGDQAG